MRKNYLFSVCVCIFKLIGNDEMTKLLFHKPLMAIKDLCDDP